MDSFRRSIERGYTPIATLATLDRVFQEAPQLPEESRMDLVERLIISSGPYTAVERERVALAESRIEERRSGAVRGVPVEDALQRVLESL